MRSAGDAHRRRTARERRDRPDAACSRQEPLTPADASASRLAGEGGLALRVAGALGPLALVHGDSHLANCFEYPTADGPRVGLIDFQGLHWGQGVRDVQYHLTYSLDPAVLAEHEDALLAHYRGALAKHGVALAPDVARAQYRALALQTLVVALVSLGLGSLTEREETMRTVLARSVAALDRLDVHGWLDAL